MHKPIIGISSRFEPGQDRFYLSRNYAEALWENGAVPVEIPLIPDSDYVSRLVRSLEGILLSGSASDLDPFRYGQAPHIRLGDVHPLRDEVDKLLLGAAETRRLPVLGICFGCQSINVFRGGTLFQDLESQVENVIKHQQGQVKDRPSHRIDLKEGSILAQLAGSNAARVNSSHHQAIDRVGKDLVPVAWASDNVIEAVTNARPDQFVLGVQWHPEIGWEKDPFSQALFQHFVSVASRVIR